LAGDKKGFPAIRFKQHFKLARDVGWHITVHAGEAEGPHSIRQAIDELGTTRIGHGVAAREDPHLMDFMANNDISIECCLTSNFQTGACTDIAQHPIKTFIQRGIVVTLNTDDPGVSGIEIGDEYKLAREVVGLSAKQLAQIQLNGVEVAFASDSVKAKLLTQFLSTATKSKQKRPLAAMFFIQLFLIFSRSSQCAYSQPMQTL
jgi:adenosine deaminase